MTDEPDTPEWSTTAGSSEDEVWVIRRVKRDWVASFRVVRHGSRFSIVEARIAPASDEPRGNLTAGVLRDATKIGRVVEKADDALSIAGEQGWQARLREVGARMPMDRRDVRLALVAYGNALARRVGSRKPNADVAIALGVGTPQVTRWVFAAREKGFLTGGGGRGRTGGELTSLASEVLMEAGKERLGIRDRNRPLYFAFEPSDSEWTESGEVLMPEGGAEVVLIETRESMWNVTALFDRLLGPDPKKP